MPVVCNYAWNLLAIKNHIITLQHGDCTAPAAPCNDVNGSKKREVGSEVNIESRTERRRLLLLDINCTVHT